MAKFCRKFYADFNGERSLKICQLLPKLRTNVKWYVFLTHSVDGMC